MCERERKFLKRERDDNEEKTASAHLLRPLDLTERLHVTPAPHRLFHFLFFNQTPAGGL